MSNWLTSTLQTVRDKSLDTIEFVRKDLIDFTTTVKNDTENYLNKIKSQPVGNFGIHRIVSRLSHKEISENEKHLAASTSFDRLHNERLRLQNDESTYLVDPTPTKTYENWREISHFNVEEHKGDITQLLIDAPHVRSIYARLVPACTTHGDFWSRYYFRLHQLNEEETRRINLLKRAHEICNETHGNDWEDLDDEDVSHVNPTVTNERTEIDTVSGDSWEREFDENITSKTTIISSDQLQQTIPMNNSVLPITVTKNTENEFDDEWESWS